MEIRLLGPLRITEHGVSYLPTAPKQRQVLALLLMHANRFVSTATCLDELWSGQPPRTARTTLQTYVMHVRHVLASVPSVGSPSAARDLLDTRDDGYVFRAAPGSLDIDVFRQRVADGRRAARAGEDLLAAGALRAALDLWYGPALVDIRTGPVLSIALADLERTRLAVVHECVATDLALARHRSLVSELTALTRRHPLDETLQGQFMLALYRCGRPVEALEVYHRLRERLLAELRVAPGARVRALYRGILRSDPVLESSADGYPDTLVPR
jgi:DNA-binding SARP family transcriptional activator